MRGYRLAFWIAILMVVGSATAAVIEDEVLTDDVSEKRRSRRTSGGIRGSGNTIERALATKVDLIREDENNDPNRNGGIPDRKTPPMANKNQFKLPRESIRDIRFPPTTPPPTRSPSRSPTKNPTGAPTKNPTIAPSKSPTSAPTDSPSKAPTLSPSETPSMSPSTLEEKNGTFQQLGRKIKVACAGGSLTRGEFGGNPRVYSYPNQLQGMLGEQDFDVFNFGKSGATAMRNLDTSYVEQVQYQWAVDKQPDIILLMLGTTDAAYWSSQGRDFQESLKQVLNSFRASLAALGASPPRIIMAAPPQVYRDNLGITNNVVRNEIRPRVIEVAQRKGVQLLNLYQLMGNQPNNYVSDGVHLNQEGYRVMAEKWLQAIQCNRNGVCEVGETCDACPGDCFIGCP